MREAVPGRVAAVAALAVLPWSVVVYGTNAQLVFPWGGVTLSHLAPFFVWDYVLRFPGGVTAIPARLVAWPLSTLLYACALASAAFGALWGREDPRLTRWVLVIAAVAHLRFWWGLVSIGELVLPFGSVLALVVAWWDYTLGER